MSLQARLTVAMCATVALATGLPSGATAQELRTYTKTASFEDVKFDLSNAITNLGLVVDFTGNVGGMLERTGKDVGSTKPIYRNAEYFSFCSAKLSREMMEADTANVGLCPFVMFAYVTAAKPAEVVVGYRRLPKGGNSASVKALGSINDMLDRLAKQAVK